MLEFGTAGIRGIVGKELDENIIAKVTEGLAKYLEGENLDKSVVIAYDNRPSSKPFAEVAAKVLSHYGVKVYIFEDLRSTPELSFAIRYLNCGSGIVITASHNPVEYNGYKVYDANGCQMSEALTDKLVKYINYDSSEKYELNNEFINYLGEEVDEAYFEILKTTNINGVDCSNLKVVYTPLYGTGSVLLPDVIKRTGASLTMVDAQLPFEFKSPYINPEQRESYDIALTYASGHDLIIATDPDSDRVGIMVLHNGEYRFLNGNSTGALFINYLVESNVKGTMIDTIVSSNFASDIAKQNGIKVISTYTGFKNIASEVENLDDFIFGYEESFGYLFKDFTRDKDANQAIIMILEMTSYYKSKGLTLLDVLEDMYQRYGYYSSKTENIKNVDKEAIMNNFIGFDGEIEGFNLVEKIDYNKKDNPTNCLRFNYDDGFFAVRPSGTEPKMKIYFCVRDEVFEKSEQKLNQLIEKVMKQMQ